MAWIFLPVLLVVGEMLDRLAYGLGWMTYLCVPMSAWLGKRYGAEGVAVAAAAWAVMTIDVRVDSYQVLHGSFDLALLGVSVAYLCSREDAEEVVRWVTSRLLTWRGALLAFAIVPLKIYLPIVSSETEQFVGIRIGLTEYFIFAPLLFAFGRASRSAYLLWGGVALASQIGHIVGLGYPSMRPWIGKAFDPTTLNLAYGLINPADVVVGIMAGVCGLSMNRLGSGQAMPSHWLGLAILVVVVGLFPLELYGKGQSVQFELVLVEAVRFSIVGGLLAGLLAGIGGAIAATLVSIGTLALLGAWMLAETPWFKRVSDTLIDGPIAFTGNPNAMIWLPILVAAFGLVGSEVRATFSSRANLLRLIPVAAEPR